MARKPKMGKATLEDMQILFRNFAGEERQFNNKGQRNFSLVLSQQEADEMARDGWNVKTKAPREDEEGGEPLYHLKCKVNFGGRPPQIVLVTDRGRTRLDEDTVGVLDYADIVKVDVILNPYEYDVNGSQGVTAYVEALFATIRENALERKYADVPELGQETRPQIESGQVEDIGELEQVAPWEG